MSEILGVIRQRKPAIVTRGNDQAMAARERALAEDAREAAEAAAASALAASGPNYESTTAGLAAVGTGQTFPVDEGRWIGVYRKDAGPVLA